MARGINKVILIGNLGTDPEVRFMPSGDAATTLSIATSESWKDKQTGETKDRTEWHKVAMFKRLAEIAGEYLKKGSKVYIEGSLRTRKWQDKNGVDHYTTEIVATDMQMLDSRGGNAPDHQQDNNYSSSSSSQDNSRSQNSAPATANTADLDDDIPF